MIWTKKYLLLLFTGLLVIYLNQCSKLKKELPTEPPENEAELHQTGWLDTLSTNFHGNYLRTHSWNLAACQKCHGNDYAGGSSESSCLSSGCHTDSPESCTTCHGGALNQTGAPPKDIDNHYQTKFKGVGAHTAHVANPRWGRSYDCTECHFKPKQLNDVRHIDSDLPAEIVWGAFSKLDNLSPVYKDSSCSNVYCHGASLSDGAIKAPGWTQSEKLACNACHGLPPGSGAHQIHIEKLQIDCNACHDGYLKNTSVKLESHIDGKRNVQMNATYDGNYANGVCSNVSCHGSGNTPPWDQDVVLNCISCHGGTDNKTGAPPVDLKGNTATTERGVGAHTLHVTNSQWANAFDCKECHIKPQTIGDPGHIDLTPSAEIVWGELSKKDGLSAGWDDNSCTNIYCHGASLKDGKITSAKWTQTEAVTCESCHGMPPESGAHEEHLEYGFSCETCHVGYQKNTTVKNEIHINGKRDVQLSATVGGSYTNGVCSNVICHGGGSTPAWTTESDFTCISCHGGLYNNTGAPPFDLKGDSTKTVKGVGAHTVHIMGGKLSDGVECTECHIKPSETDSEGHIGVELLPAEITWGDLAKVDGAAPSWDDVRTCQNVYCHGEFKFGNKNNDPIWINFEGTQPCGSCHGVPPASPHPQITNCSLCHSIVVDEANNIINKAKHINGQADFVNKK